MNKIEIQVAYCPETFLIKRIYRKGRWVEHPLYKQRRKEHYEEMNKHQELRITKHK